MTSSYTYVAVFAKNSGIQIFVRKSCLLCIFQIHEYLRDDDIALMMTLIMKHDLSTFLQNVFFSKTNLKNI